ncbi:MAG: NADH-quinone oxidoreductase subunit C [Myxococcales bacterium]|nr:MAG: NADH-quinone oxidoreductase subunit C [Myxococcales bacterium]
MSKSVVDRLKAEFAEKILSSHDEHGDDEVVVAPADWVTVATYLRDDPQCAMQHFIDITAVDYPEREPQLPRFDVLLLLRSLKSGFRIRIKTRISDGDQLSTLSSIWKGCNWGEREIYDMFGIVFEGHPDMRRILLYDEFEGFPLRKDYPIEAAQPLIPYREVDGIEKLAPFGKEEGQPWNRIDWLNRLKGGDKQVSPAIGVQQGQRSSLSSTAISKPKDATRGEA